MTRHVQIDRLELDLRGLDPALAEAAVQALGPALQRELARRQVGPRSPLTGAPRIDAGHVPASGDAHTLAQGLAARIVASSQSPHQD